MLTNVKILCYVTLHLTLFDINEPNFYVNKPQIWTQLSQKLR